MKKILMLAMMVITMGLVGCGEMTAEEMEREIVSIAEENGYEMIIIKKNDTEVESSTFSMREVVETTPEPTPTVATTPTPVPTKKVTPTPLPTPTSVPTEESEDVNVTDEVIDYKIDPNTGEKVPVYATPTPTPEPIVDTNDATVWKYAKCVALKQRSQDVPYVYRIIFTLYLEDFNIDTTIEVKVTEEEYEIAKNYEMARIELAADENGKLAIPMWGPFEVLNYEFVTE